MEINEKPQTAEDILAMAGIRCCGTCKHWKNQKTPITYAKRHCHHSGFYGGDIKSDSTANCKWEAK